MKKKVKEKKNHSSLEYLLSCKDFKEYKYVYIYSDLRYFLSENQDNIDLFMKNFLNIFLKNKQTLIIPTFSYSKKKFDIKNDKSSLGFLSNYVLKLKGTVRSEHPIFSYAAYGPDKNIVKNIGKSAFGHDSVHQRLLFKNCCFLHIGRSLLEGNTMVHHVEQNLKANYRFDKIFKTKVYKNKIYVGTNYSAYVKKNIKNKSHFFSFEKTNYEIKKKKFIKYLKKEKNLKSLFYYSYDEMYFFLHDLFIKDDKIFLT